MIMGNRSIFAILPITCLTLLLIQVAEGRGRTNKLEDGQNPIVSAALVDDFVGAFEDVFNGLLTNFEHDRGTVVDQIQKATSGMLSNWEEENQELASLCISSQRDKCDAATSELQKKRQGEIAEATKDLPRMKLTSMNDYLLEFVHLQTQEMERRSSIESAKRELEKQLENAPAGSKTESRTIQSLKLLDLVCNDLDEIASTLEKTVTALNGVVYGNVCFDFLGASMEIQEERKEEYNEAMREALNFAFMEEKVDVEVVGFQIVDEDFTNSGTRKLRRKTLPGNRELYRKKSSTANVVGVTCRCPKDVLVSDVYRRSLQEEAGRELFSDAILTTFATVLRDELPDLYGKLESVATIHCSEFDYLHAIGSLSGGSLTHVISAATVSAEPEATVGTSEVTGDTLTMDYTTETVDTSPDPEPVPPVGYVLRLTEHSCDTFMDKFLGDKRKIRSPEKCYAAAVSDPACTGNEFAFSPARGCICCQPKPSIGYEAFSSSPYYSIYEYN